MNNPASASTMNQFKSEVSSPIKYGRLENQQVQVPMDTALGYPSDQQPGIPVHWSWCNLVWSVISIFCCPIFGIIAMIMAILAYGDHKVKDYYRSRSKRNVAWGFAIAALVIGIIVTLVVIIVIKQTTTAIVNFAQDNIDNAMEGMDNFEEMINRAMEGMNNTGDMVNDEFKKSALPDNFFGSYDSGEMVNKIMESMDNNIGDMVNDEFKKSALPGNFFGSSDSD